MSVEMAIWRMTEDGPQPLEFTRLAFEARLEDMIVEDPGLVGLDVLVIGRQVATSFGGFLDILAVDREARLHVLELKRDRTPRDVVAQTLDYGAWSQDLGLDDVSEIFARQYEGADFDAAFAERFDQPLPDVFNPDQQLTIVASELDPTSDRIVEYLAERYGMPINAVFFRHFRDGSSEYLARTWLLAPAEVAAVQSRGTRRSKVRPWNGRDYYVILGNLEGDGRWDLARRLGVLTAGGGSWYWKPLRNLTPGSRVFAYVGGAGYVGVGTVTGTITPVSDAKVELEGVTMPLLDAPGIPNWLAERGRQDDLEQTEFAVSIDWHETRPIEGAVSERGLFSSQVTVCKLRDERTIEVLEAAFESTAAP